MRVPVKVLSRVLPSVLLVTTVACSSAPTDEAPADRPAVPVAVAVARVTKMSALHEAGGIVRSRATALVASRVMATVTAVPVRPGDRVRSGDVLVTLDRRDREADASRTAAVVASAREGVHAAEADVRAAESATGLARVTQERLAALHERRSATTQELDQATAALRAAEAQLESARARLRAASASLLAASAAAEMADVGLTDTTLRAPFDGIVTERRVDPGTLAVPGTPLMTVDGTGGLRLEADVDEARSSYLVVGQQVEVRLDARSDRWMPASVSEIARVDPTSHAFLVKVDLPSGTTAPSGTFGRLRFPGSERETLAVPASAIIRRSALTFTFVVDTEGLARLTPVTVGPTNGDQTEVLAGLHEGDRVVTAPPLTLTDGARTTEGARR